jgi:hypothetical protein
MPLVSTLVVRFESRSSIRAGTRKGSTQNQTTTIDIKEQTSSLSRLEGRRESGVVRPIVTANDRRTNFARPAVTQKNGGMKASELSNRVATSIPMTTEAKK